jgi:single-strand DNA-binding protein|tara:strand:+ start:210 stop:608 length:399 start_codon:yes stop_codon:yes gene_type:complete
MSVNKVILVGRLGHDPELRSTKGGTSVVNIRLATNERRKDGGEWVDHTEWHTVTVWGKQAENLEKYCTKGKQLYVEGRLQTREFQDKTGADRKSTEVVADQVKFLGDRGDSQGQRNNGHSPSRGGSDESVPF